MENETLTKIYNMLTYIYIHIYILDYWFGSVWTQTKPNHSGWVKHELIGLCKEHWLVWIGLTLDRFGLSFLPTPSQNYKIEFSRQNRKIEFSSQNRKIEFSSQNRKTKFSRQKRENEFSRQNHKMNFPAKTENRVFPPKP